MSEIERSKLKKIKLKTSQFKKNKIKTRKHKKRKFESSDEAESFTFEKISKQSD